MENLQEHNKCAMASGEISPQKSEIDLFKVKTEPVVEINLESIDLEEFKTETDVSEGYFSVQGYDKQPIKIETEGELDIAEKCEGIEWMEANSETDESVSCTENGEDADEIFKCLTCGEIFSSESIFTSHISSHLRTFSRERRKCEEKQKMIRTRADHKDKHATSETSHRGLVEKKSATGVDCEYNFVEVSVPDGQENLPTMKMEAENDEEHPTILEAEANADKASVIYTSLSKKESKNKQCEKCSKYFTKREFEYHVTFSECSPSAQNEVHFKCGKCSQSFVQKCQYYLHIKLCTGRYIPHHGEGACSDCSIPEEICLQCTKCGKKFPDHSRFYMHLHLGCNGAKKSFYCSKCDQRFLKKTRYDSHLSSSKCATSRYKPKSNGQGSKKESSDIIGVDIGRVQTPPTVNQICIKLPILQTNEQPPEPLNLPIRNAISTPLSDSHIFSTDCEPLSFKCENCDKQFMKKFLYDFHVKSCSTLPVVHTGKRILKCFKCGQSVVGESGNEFHVYCKDCSVKKVTFKCVKCKELFDSQSQLEVHVASSKCFILNKKDGSQSFVCAYKRFLNRSPLYSNLFPSDCVPPDFQGKILEVGSQKESCIHVQCKPGRSKCGVSRLGVEKKSSDDAQVIREECKHESFKSNEGGLAFENESSHNAHNMREEPGSLDCTVDEESFDETHVKHEECTPDSFECKLEGLAFEVKSSFVGHAMREEFKPESYKCKRCGQRFDEDSQYEFHMSCTVCSEESSYDVPAMHEECKPGSYDCKIEEQAFETESSYIAYAMHEECKPDSFECEKCGKCFDEESQYEFHISCTLCSKESSYDAPAVLEECKSESYNCNKCGQCFEEESQYEFHMSCSLCSMESPAMREELPESFKCEKCGQCFEKESQYEFHISCTLCSKESSYDAPAVLEECKSESYNCKKCGQCFEEESQYEFHMSCSLCSMESPAMREELPESFKCEKCGQCFEKESQYEFHTSCTLCSKESSHDTSDDECKPESFKCKKCGQCFEKESQYEFHMSCALCSEESSHDTPAIRDECKPESFKCEKCGKCFEKESQYEFHMSCTVCSLPSADQISLSFSEMANASSQLTTPLNPILEESGYICTICEMDFKEVSQYQHHMKTHTCARTLPFRCGTCGEAFKRFIGLENHVSSCIRTKKKGKKFVCGYCQRSFFVIHRLKKHVQWHRRKKYCCSYCPKFFRIKPYLEKHILGLHFGVKNFACAECGMKFFHNYELKVHLNTDNENQPFVCFRCDQRFAYNCTWKAHLLLHADEPPYSCHFCQKTFAKYDNLKKHLSRHTANMSYHCRFCGKQYFSFAYFKDHLRRHTESPAAYRCSKCPRVYSTEDSLRKHFAGIHGDEKHICGNCGVPFETAYLLKVHMQSYCSGNPVLECNECATRFFSKLLLTRHIVEFHSIKVKKTKVKRR